MSYALDAGRAEHLPEQLAGRAARLYLPHREGDAWARAAAAVTFDRVAGRPRHRICRRGGRYRLAALAGAEAAACAPSMSTTVYETSERPLAPVLALMERHRVKVERRRSPTLSGIFAQTIARLEDEIRELAGEDFNIGSPKQLGEILFDKMSLPGGRRTKTGAWSTDAARARGACRRRPRAAAQGSRLAPARQAQEHLYRRASRLYPPRDGTRAHLLRARRHHDRAALLARAESAEHPGAHERRAAPSARPSSPTRARS